MCFTAQGQEVEQLDTIPQIKEEFIRQDDPVLLAIDEAMLHFYRESDPFLKTPMDTTFLTTPIVISDQEMAMNLKKLDEETPFDFRFNSSTKAYVNLYVARRKKFVSKLLSLKEYYFPIFEEALARHDMPMELKYLPIVESALNPTARSRAGAKGLWQFMYATGKMYNLNVTSYEDERSDVYKSTEAACKYLKKLYGMYKSWELALAAYNAGPGNVNKAIRRSGGKRSYWNIRPYLPRETRNYVPAFIGVNYAMAYAGDYGITPLNYFASNYEFDTLIVKERIDFEWLSFYLDLSKEKISYFNPSFRKGIIPNTSKFYTLILPVTKVGAFIANEECIFEESIPCKEEQEKEKQKSIGEFTYRVKSGDYLGKIAERYHVGVSQIKRWNNLRSNRLRIGQRLVIYTDKKYSKSKPKPSKSVAQVTLPSDGKHVIHTVKSGDTLWDIVKLYPGSSIEKIKSHNNINPRALRSGMKLKIVI